ncbi:MAG: nucleotidyltransferase family protein [Euryarchaeota archaeon]|nr:nucleotidyltransferase family protein [Euryarchaeota archaeon]
MNADILRERRDDILKVAARHKARNVRVFGSVARGEAGPRSDIDLVVRMEPDATLFDLIALERDLQEMLGQKVQVISEAGLKSWARDRILDEAVSF